jgi:hypothetical protein
LRIIAAIVSDFDMSAVVDHLDLALRRQLRAQRLDLGGVAEAVEDDIRADGGETRRDSEADARRRSGHQRGFTFEHGEPWRKSAIMVHRTELSCGRTKPCRN